MLPTGCSTNETTSLLTFVEHLEFSECMSFKYVILFSYGKLESIYIIQDTLHILEVMHIALRKRRYIYAFLTEHLEFQE